MLFPTVFGWAPRLGKENRHEVVGPSLVTHELQNPEQPLLALTPRLSNPEPLIKSSQVETRHYAAGQRLKSTEHLSRFEWIF